MIDGSCRVYLLLIVGNVENVETWQLVLEDRRQTENVEYIARFYFQFYRQTTTRRRIANNNTDMTE